MSIRAVGWLGSKLGLDIGGRGTDDGGSGRTDSFAREELAGFGTTENCSSRADPVASNTTTNSSAGEGTLTSVASQWEARLGRVWRQANEKATQFWMTNVRSGGGGGDRNDPFGLGLDNGGGSSGGTGDNPELDDNGLPVTRNWYYFDANLGRWTVSADAPQSVQREYYEQLGEVEKERLGQKSVVAPPPPPMGGVAMRSATNGGAPLPPRGVKCAPGGLLGAGGARGGHGPQYAMPDYFGSTVPAPNTNTTQAYAGGVHSSPQCTAQSHLSADPFPSPPNCVNGMNGLESQSGYASNLPYSGTPGTVPIRASPYPPNSLSLPHDIRRPIQAQPSPPPPSQTKPIAYASAPYPPSSAHSPPNPAPLPLNGPMTSFGSASRSTQSPTSASFHESYPVPSQPLPPPVPHQQQQQQMQSLYDASPPRQNHALVSPSGTNNNPMPWLASASQQYTLPPQQQPQQQELHAIYPPLQSNHHGAYNSDSPYNTNCAPSYTLATPPMQDLNSYASSTFAVGHFSDNAKLHTQGSPVRPPYGSAPPPPATVSAVAAPPTAAPSYDYGAAVSAPSVQSASGSSSLNTGKAGSGATPAAAWQQPQQQQAPSSLRPTSFAPVTNNHFVQRHSANSSVGDAPAAALPAAPTLTLSSPPPRPYQARPQQPAPSPNGNNYPAGNGVPVTSAPAAAAASAPSTAVPTAARHPLPPSFKPFSPS